MHVLIAVDDTPESLMSVQRAYDLFGRDATYTVATIGENPTPVLPPTPFGSGPNLLWMSENAEWAESHAVEVAAAAGETIPVEVDTEVEVGQAGPAICRIAAEQSADLVVIGWHDHSIWDRILHPSVGRYVVEHAPCSVLVVR